MDLKRWYNSQTQFKWRLSEIILTCLDSWKRNEQQGQYCLCSLPSCLANQTAQNNPKKKKHYLDSRALEPCDVEALHNQLTTLYPSISQQNQKSPLVAKVHYKYIVWNNLTVIQYMYTHTTNMPFILLFFTWTKYIFGQDISDKASRTSGPVFAQQ